MLELRKSQDRGTGKQDWLEARFTFSFGSYQDPAQNGFSDLKLLNDDRVAPGGGFATHSHQDMEVFSYVLAGALEHKDSMGEGSVVRAGDVIAMSTGSGITHSEFNHSKSEPVHFFQIWVAPDRQGVAPRYQQKHFSDVEKRGHLRLLLSPDGAAAVPPVAVAFPVGAGCLGVRPSSSPSSAETAVISSWFNSGDNTRCDWPPRFSRNNCTSIPFSLPPLPSAISSFLRVSISARM